MTNQLKILYIDEVASESRDFKRAFKNYDHFNIASLIPISELDELVGKILELEPDILIIDFMLGEYKSDVQFDGGDLVSAIHKIKYDLPCIIFTSYKDDAINQSSYPNIIHYKGVLTDKDQKEELIKIIERNVAVYKNNITEKQDRHASLIQKLQKDGHLIRDDENELLELDQYLESITNHTQSIPSKLKEDLLSGQLDTLINDTRELLEQAKRDR